MSSSTGAELIATTLKNLGVRVVFGLVGIPVVEVAEACIALGIQFIGFRNEQSASYAASAWGYLSGQPGVCLVVAGPGVVHALAGLVNAQENCWPMVLLGGSCETYQRGQGAFQEFPQVAACRPYTKYAEQPPCLDQLPATLIRAFHTSVMGRPGPCFVELPADFIRAPTALLDVTDHDRSASVPVPRTVIPKPMGPLVTLADPTWVTQAVDCLLGAKAPLVIIGKGAAYARAESAVQTLIQNTGWCFLPTAMGKGVVSDLHPQCVGSARSEALRQADVVLLLGARVNWMLHFGQRFNTNAKLIQVDIAPEEMGRNRPVDIPLVGDVGAVVTQLNDTLASRKSTPVASEFQKQLTSHIHRNKDKLQRLLVEETVPMTYHRVYNEVKQVLGADYHRTVIVNEGANTMDIGRVVFHCELPRHRLDAGTFATMGVGLGYSIAAKLYYPDRPVVAVLGDSAFGFSAMEIETAVRARIPLVIIVMNNGGIYHGVSPQEYDRLASQHQLPSTALSQGTRYDLMAQGLGAKGYHVCKPEELHRALSDALKLLEDAPQVHVINCVIQPGGDQKINFAWLNTEKQARL
ncbi:hypothetical protein IWQ62_002565 [Dispira parvispora]|uniref:2-hydroxyacyl-CoA lyase n=1 Tax=Dispira parvispora TaxID=1520584 RepID=A0A9W8E2J4_9FUNG|nr:hypothetical protein IWQ62_002565 [Dispira parvispora]